MDWGRSGRIHLLHNDVTVPGYPLRLHISKRLYPQEGIASKKAVGILYSDHES
jgi:hypothetical protein